MIVKRSSLLEPLSVCSLCIPLRNWSKERKSRRRVPATRRRRCRAVFASEGRGAAGPGPCRHVHSFVELPNHPGRRCPSNSGVICCPDRARFFIDQKHISWFVAPATSVVVAAAASSALLGRNLVRSESRHYVGAFDESLLRAQTSLEQRRLSLPTGLRDFFEVGWLLARVGGVSDISA